VFIGHRCPSKKAKLNRGTTPEQQLCSNNSIEKASMTSDSNNYLQHSNVLNIEFEE